MYRSSFCILALTGLLSGGTALAAPKAAPKGWECLASPDNLNKPGRVFYIENGTRYEFGDYSEGLVVTESDTASGTWVEKGKASLSLFAKLLSVVSPVSGQFGVGASKSYDTSMELGERKLRTTDEGPMLTALRKIDPSLLKPNRKYFMIRNTLTASTVTITVDNSIAAAFGGDVSFRNAVQLSGSASGSQAGGAESAPSTSAPKPDAVAVTQPSTGPTKPTATLPSTPSNSIISAAKAKAYAIQANFTPPATVCILAQRFTSKSIFGGAGGTVIQPKLYKEYWTPY